MGLKLAISKLMQVYTTGLAKIYAVIEIAMHKRGFSNAGIVRGFSSNSPPHVDRMKKISLGIPIEKHHGMLVITNTIGTPMQCFMQTSFAKVPPPISKKFSKVISILSFPILSHSSAPSCLKIFIRCT
ncbi:hypothetical protein KQX54_021566 [Cotesia glomerata]|uniref:Uncharacterized protein n=1 Tax=Cotesia glomerata TaxID=32391 RepID=A0AAV7J715_COTGL|nr:hypothetical protein KQX54_021566 [Cotesia glomerata]